MLSHSFTAKQVNDLEGQILNMLKSGYRPTLGIVFCSPKQDYEGVSRLFNLYNIDLLGCTTAGEINNDALNDNSITCLLMDISQDKYRLFTVQNTEGVLETGKELRALADASFENPAMIVCSSGLFNDGEKVVEGLKMGQKAEIPLFGGLAGDDLAIVNTHIFTKDVVLNNGMSAIVFDNDKVEVQGLATSGWQPLGVYNTVTKAEGNTIYSINNEPALDFFVQFFGEHENVVVKGENLSTISAQYPLQVMRTADYSVLRSPISGNMQDRSLTLVGSVKEGDKFRFSISPGIEVIDATLDEFNSFKYKMPEADALILFSCKGRHAALGPFLEDEVKGIYDMWEKPMIGFLSYGEIGNLRNGICEFHNETCSLLLIKEK
jgi:hypothetical protein